MHDWKECQRLAHKLKGTVLTLSLDCCPDAVSLDLALKRHIKLGDAEGQSITLGAVFVDIVGAVLEFLAEHPN